MDEMHTRDVGIKKSPLGEETSKTRFPKFPEEWPEFQPGKVPPPEDWVPAPPFKNGPFDFIPLPKWLSELVWAVPTGVCTPGETKCEGYDLYTCNTQGEWKLTKHNSVQCGYTPPGVCTPGQTKCEGYNLLTCGSDKKWHLTETNSAQCGYTPPEKKLTASASVRDITSTSATIVINVSPAASTSVTVDGQTKGNPQMARSIIIFTNLTPDTRYTVSWGCYRSGYIPATGKFAFTTTAAPPPPPPPPPPLEVTAEVPWYHITENSAWIVATASEPCYLMAIVNGESSGWTETLEKTHTFKPTGLPSDRDIPYIVLAKTPDGRSANTAPIKYFHTHRWF